MRHRKKFNHLGRKSAHRQAMLSNMAASLILHKRIKTTLQKARALRVYAEPLITRSKDNTTHSRRIVFSYLQNKEAVTELFRTVADKVGDRPGGYTRILKLGTRIGDSAEMCYIELVDFNENMLKTETKKTTTRRSRRGTGKSAATATEPKAEKPVAPKKVEEKSAEEAAAVQKEPVAEVAETVVEEPTAIAEEPAAEEAPTTEEEA